MTRRKFFLFAAAAALLSVVVMLAGLLALDLFIHYRASRSAGLNRWGYRGPVVGRKQPGETRVAVLGGSTTFGYGVTWDEAVPALLEQELKGHAGRWSVVNLGYNNEGAYALVPNLEDFGYLDFDIAVFYVGYNDLAGDEDPNYVVVRHASPVFRATGYFPILPAWLEEKAFAIRYDGDLNAGYAAARGEKGQKVFRPGLAARTSASALEAAARVGESMGRQLDRVAEQALPSRAVTGEAGCAPPWVNYCDAVTRAVRLARAGGMRVLVVEQPLSIGDRLAVHGSQRQALASLMQRRFGGDAGVQYVDLSGAVDLGDGDLTFDQMHLNVDGNRLIAEALVEPVRRLAIQP